MKKKIITAVVLALAAIALIVATVFTTIAYLTSSSAVTNTFTVGNVGIHLYESNIDANGKAIADDPNINGNMKDSNGNNYHLMSGKTYDKDPTIYITSSSDASYVFVKVRNTIKEIEAGHFVHNSTQSNVTDNTDKPTIEEQLEENGWYKHVDTATGTVYVYATKNGENIIPKAIGGTTGIYEVNVFQEFSIDNHADVSLYGGAKVNITAFAIQTSGFEDNATAAWNAIVETYPYESGSVSN